MRLHPSSFSSDQDGATRPAFLRRIGTPVVAGAALIAVVAALVGLAAANSSSSSSTSSSACEAASAVDQTDCENTADTITATSASSAVTAGDTTVVTSEPDHAAIHVVPAPTEPDSTDPTPATSAPDAPDPVDPTSTAPSSTAPSSSEPEPKPEPGSDSESESADPGSTDPAPANPGPTTTAQVDPGPTSSIPASADYADITTFGVFHGTSSHTHGDSLAGGRTPITTEALVAYNGLRSFVGLGPVELEAIGQWAFANRLTNNAEAYGQELRGVGLYYGMQGAKVGWIRDDAFDPQILADIQRSAREGQTDAVMAMVETYGRPGYADHLVQAGLVGAFVNTLKMEPHYGGWMHGRVHGFLSFSDGTGASVAIAHDLNHLTVLSHDQTQPFMNDTFDWPQWPALDVPAPDVADYFQSMVALGDPRGTGL